MARSIVMLICCIGLMISCSKQEKTGDQLFWSSGSKASKMLNQVLADSLQVTWSTGAHTSAPVPIGAIGPEEYTRQLKGVRQNTDFFPVINQALANRVRVIVVIGDGLGFSHLAFLLYRNIALQNPNSSYFERIMNEGVNGLCLNNQYGQIVTGSSEAATSIASGKKSRSGMVGLDADGYPTETVLDIAEKNQIPTGLITDTRLTHATPAGFYANIMDRGKEAEISRQLAEDYQIEVLMGGGAAYFLPESTQVSDDPGFANLNSELNCRSKRKDKLNLIKTMQDKGYAVVCTKTELNRLDQRTDKVLGLFAGSEMNATIDRDDENTGEPSIPLMTSRAIDFLSRPDQGFFLMVECGRIDWESHANDAGAMVKAVDEMDQTLEVCYNFYTQNPGQTLIIFTADHETGGPAFSYYSADSVQFDLTLPAGNEWSTRVRSAPFANYLKLFNQKMSVGKIFAQAQSAENLRQLVNDNMPFTISPNEARRIYRALK